MRQDQQPDYYEILGVRSTASPEEITRAYRKALRAVHPDASGTSGLFRLVKMAYDTLSDPAARAAYDLWPTTAPSAPAPPPAPEPSPEPCAEPRSAPGSRAEEKPPPQARPTDERRREEAAPGASAPPADPAEAEPEGAGPGTRLRVRPRFGAHWGRVAATAAVTLACLVAVFALWPAGLPVDLFVLLLLPVIAGPVIAMMPTLRSRTWPWAACLVPFSATAALAIAQSGGSFWPLGGALAGLTLAGAGLTAAPYVVERGRELDTLVSSESLAYQIFNVPGAGLGSATAREIARISAVHVERLAALNGLRVVHGLVPPQLPGQARCYVDHAVMRDNRLALVMTRRWPAANYAWTAKGTLTADGHRFRGGDTGIAGAVKAFSGVVPRGVRVRGFVAVLPGESPGMSSPGFPPAESGGLYAGTLAQVTERLASWMDEAGPVVHRRMFAAVLPHVRRPQEGPEAGGRRTTPPDA